MYAKLAAIEGLSIVAVTGIICVTVLAIIALALHRRLRAKAGTTGVDIDTSVETGESEVS